MDGRTLTSSLVRIFFVGNVVQLRHPMVISSSWTHTDIYGQNFNGYTHIFKVQLFTGVVDDVIGSRVIPEIDMAAAQTGSNTISAHRTTINKIPSPTSIF